jgi:hypothetical protein
VFQDEDEDVGVYWVPGEHSGLYESAVQAERGAFDDVPWLRRLSRRTEDAMHGEAKR